MAFDHLDPPELTSQGIPADPIKRGAPDRKPKPKLGIFPKPDGAIAPVDPSAAYTAAVQEVADARAALIQRTAEHRAAEAAEGVAVVAWMQLNRPSENSVTRDFLRKDGERKMANVAAGRPADYTGPVAGIDNSPISQAAKNRGRHAGGNRQAPGVPLRSNIARRNV